MWTNEDQAVAAGHSAVPAWWRSMFDQLMDRISGRFTRVGPRRRTAALVLGLLSDLPKKNRWTLAEHAGDATPDGMRHLPHRAKWDADAVRDDVRAYAVEHLRDDEAVLVVDETGDLKKGTATVGVQAASRTHRSPSTWSTPWPEGMPRSTRRWTVEETFQASKGLAGLDEHQVRRWTSWHRWVTLAMLAHAFIAVTAAAERRDHPAPEDLIP